MKGKDPYPLIKPHQHIQAPPGQPAYDVYDPYLPLMSLFGGPRSTDAPLRLTDARVGVLGVHDSDRGGGDGAVPGPRARACWPCRA